MNFSAGIPTFSKSLAIAFLTALLVAPAVARSCDCMRSTEWKFRVLLDGSEIGYHNFLLTTEDDLTRLTTEADFSVKFLFFTAYRYRHTNTETWRDNCLQNIDASTNANGKTLFVSGSRDEDGLNIETNLTSKNIGDCIKTFAYWNPEIFKEAKLLNAQTGELLAIEAKPAGAEILTVRGEELSATRYHLVAKNIELDVWYSDEDRWLALESTVKGGRKLRYELI